MVVDRVEPSLSPRIVLKDQESFLFTEEMQQLNLKFRMEELDQVVA